MVTQTPLNIGDRFMINHPGTPRGTVFTIKDIRPSRGAFEGDGAVFVCSETARNSMPRDTPTPMRDDVLIDYHKRGQVVVLGAKPE